MPYIGRQPLTGRYTLIDDISSSFNGTLTSFSMTSGSSAVNVFLAHALILSLGGVIQKPETDYTVSGSTLTFTSPPAAGVSFFASLLGDTLNVGQPSDKAVITKSIADGAVATGKIADNAITGTKLARALTVTSNTTFSSSVKTFTGANTTIGSTQFKISSANTVIQGAHNNIVSANTVFSGHVLFEGTAKSVGTTTGFASATAVSTDAQQTFTKAQVPSTFGANGTTTLASTSGVLNFDDFQNFIVVLASGTNTLDTPTTEASQIGQTGVIVFVQPSSGTAGSVSIAGDYETQGGSTSLNLSTGNNDYDIVPYFIKADNSILLGASQKNFG